MRHVLVLDAAKTQTVLRSADMVLQLWEVGNNLLSIHISALEWPHWQFSLLGGA